MGPAGEKGDPGAPGAPGEQGPAGDPAPVEPLAVGAVTLQSISGSPSTAWVGSNAGGRYRVWTMDGSSNEAVGAVVLVPHRWSAVNVHLWWTNVVGSAGMARWQAYLTGGGPGADLTASNALGGFDAPAPATGVLTRTLLTSAPVAVTPGQMLKVNLERAATHSNDTLAGDAGVLAIELTPA